jgi:hypothetical protein
MKVKTTPMATKIIIVNNDIPRSLPIFSLLALACWCPLDDRGVLQKCFVISSSDNPKRCSVCDPAKTFLTSKFSYLLFCNPTHKTKTGIPNGWKTTNSKSLGPIIMIGCAHLPILKAIPSVHSM